MQTEDVAVFVHESGWQDEARDREKGREWQTEEEAVGGWAALLLEECLM